ncbi:hypothetical protein [Sphingobium sp. WCS2017Hpa-17]|uniref:hypothetical protein n=1 Tax=Sphingobium sp. WCS2017Hpa-17 TaxID=3073638 RepID=UPI00288C54AB|nr:hypothetical protein [Sphingobium sp. WCS2017Hpa-17]
MALGFNAGRSHHVHIYERPGAWMPAEQLAALVHDCRTVVHACLSGRDLDYGLFDDSTSAWSRSVITLIRRRSDDVPIAFNAMPLLSVNRAGRHEDVLHLGLVMVDPSERSAGLSWILYGLTCFALFLRRRMRPLWISSVTQVPAVVGMVAETFGNVFPAQASTRQSFAHRHLAHQIMRHHRAAFGVGPEADFDLDRQVIMDAYTGGSDNLKKGFDRAAAHRDQAYNDFCRRELDYDRGDDVLQIGVIDLGAGHRFLARSVPRGALPQLMVQALVIATGALVVPMLQWLDPSRAFQRLRPAR